MVIFEQKKKNKRNAIFEVNQQVILDIWSINYFAQLADLVRIDEFFVI
jgi:hypothetical protein